MLGLTWWRLIGSGWPNSHQPLPFLNLFVLINYNKFMEEGEDKVHRKEHNIRFYEQEYPHVNDLVMVNGIDPG